MSAQFKIYIVDNNEKKILISDYKPNNETPTFNENLTQDENNNFTLSFSISQNYKDYFPQNFNLFEYLKIGRKLILEKPKTEEEILFTIESISPEGRNKDIIWNIVAKDYISYNFSKNNIGLSINTFESDDYLKWIEDNFLEGTASDIINYILQKGYLQEANFFSEIDNPLFLQNNWKCAFFETNLNTFKTKGLEIQENPLNKKINIDISNSNTYNALIEVALITESFILFDFKNKLVDLISRNDDFFRKNYILSPEFNLKDLSLTYSGDEFYPILYVTGGQDEFGLATTLIPFLTYKQYLILKDYFEEKDPNDELLNVIDFEEYENNFYDSVNWEGDAPTKETLLILNSIPYLDSFIINLTYYLENDLIDPNDRNEIMNRIYNDLRKINLEFQREIFNFYTTQGNINEIESRILSITDQVVLSEENDYLSLNEKLSSVYLKSGGGILDPELKAESDINPQEVFANTELTKEFLYDDGYLFYEISKEAYEYLESLQPPFSNFDPLTDPPSKIQEKQVYKDDSDSLNIKYYASTNFRLRYPIELKFEKDGAVNNNITFTSTASSHIFDEGKPLWPDDPNKPDKYQLLIKTKNIDQINKLKIPNSCAFVNTGSAYLEPTEPSLTPVTDPSTSPTCGSGVTKISCECEVFVVGEGCVQWSCQNSVGTLFSTSLDIKGAKYEKEWVDSGIIPDSVIIGQDGTKKQEIPTNVGVNGRFIRVNSSNNLATRFRRTSTGQTEIVDNFPNTIINTMPVYGRWMKYEQPFNDINVADNDLEDLSLNYFVNIDATRFVSVLTKWSDTNKNQKQIQITLRNISDGQVLSTLSDDILVSSPGDVNALDPVINDVRIVTRSTSPQETRTFLTIIFRKTVLGTRSFTVWVFLLSGNSFIRQTLDMGSNYNSAVFGELPSVHRKMHTFSPALDIQNALDSRDWHFYFEDKGITVFSLKPQFLKVLQAPAGQTSPITIRELTGDQYFNYIDSGCLLTSNNINKHWIFVATNLSSSSFRIEFIEWNGTTATNRFSQTDQTGDKVIQTYYHESKQTLFVLTNLGISVYRITLNASNNISVSSRLLISTGNIPIQGFIPSGDSLYVKRNNILQLYAIFGNNIFSWNNTPSWLSYNRPLAYWDTKSGFIYGPTDSIIFKNDSQISSAFEFYKYSYNTNVTRQTTTTNENGLNLEFTNFYTLPEIKKIFRNQWKPIINYNLTTGFTIPTDFATLQSTSLQYITNLVITDFRLMPYFELLRVYGGLDFLENKEKELEDLCLDFIELKNESEEAIQNTLQNGDFSEYSVLETRIDGYKALIGDATGFIKNNLENQELYQSNFRRPKELKWNSIGSNLKIINKNLISFSDGSSTATTFIDVEQNIKKDNVYYYKAKFRNLEKVAIDFNVFVPGDSSFSRLDPNTWKTVEGLFTGISEMKIEYTCIDGVWNFRLVNIDKEVEDLLHDGYKARIQLVRYHPARRSKVEKSSRNNFAGSISSAVKTKPNYPSYLNSTSYFDIGKIIASEDISNFSTTGYQDMDLSTWANNMIKFGQKPNRIRSVAAVQQTFNNLGYFFLNYGFVLLIDNKKFGTSNVFEARYSFIDGDTNINPNYTIENNIVNINKAVLDVPTIQSGFTCTINSLNNETSVDFSVLLNNQGTQNITVRASLNSNFSDSITTIANGGSNIFMSLIHNTSGNPPGEVTVYVRLEKTGFTNSTAVNKTETLTICFIQ